MLDKIPITIYHSASQYKQRNTMAKSITMEKAEVTKLTIANIKKNVTVGRWVRAEFTDSGHLDGLVIEKDDSNEYLYAYICYFPATRNTDKVGADQIRAIGNYLSFTSKDSGL
jgi:hypothetical protein